MYGNCMVWVKDYVINRQYKIRKHKLDERIRALHDLIYSIYPSRLTFREYKSGLYQVEKKPADPHQVVDGDYFIEIDGGFFHGMPCVEVYTLYNQGRIYGKFNKH